MKKTVKPAGNKAIKPMVTSVGAAFLLGSAAPAVLAAENPFTAQPLTAGYEQLAYGPKNRAQEPEKKTEEAKCGEGKCGEGKCGEDAKKAKDADKAEEGKCGEGKCGEGKCGGEKTDKG